jgi:3-methyladenine DNA glycosylase AlkD
MKAQSQSSSIRKKRSNAPRGNQASVEAWTVARAIGELRRHGKQRNIDGMARYGIRAEVVFGVSKPKMDAVARQIGKNHDLGLRLWATGIHDGRLLGMLISEPHKVTARQMEVWVRDFDNWDVCDGTCCHLFVFAAPAWKKAFAWTNRKAEFEKRAGFALAAYLAVHDKSAADAPFRKFLSVIEREAWDDRNFVRKAVNWALRNIGKRNLALNRAAIACAERIHRSENRAARWIAADALRELRSDAVQNRLHQKRSLKLVNRPKIRRARVADAERIAVLSGQLGYATSTKTMAKRLKNALGDNRGACYVAETGGLGVMGWIHVSVTPLLEVERRAEVNGLIVDERARSSGIGLCLLCTGMSVRSNVLRERAHGFYLRHGYEHFKTQRAFRKSL